MTDPGHSVRGPRRLYVHLGLQKTGTSYLQGVMLANREELAAQGLDLVPPTKRETFHVMLTVRDRYSPEHDPPEVPGSLERLTAQLHDARGSRALLSQESLAAATPEQVRRLLAACGDREVHVVATVRDLARQLPSSWQQSLKAGGTVPYDRYLRRLQRMEERGAGEHPWIHLDPPAVLARWAAELAPERVHVVTVPPSGSPPTLLLERFCRVLDVDPARLQAQQEAGNTSLGRVQAEVLRRVNEELPADLRRRQVYGDVGKRFFAVRVLGAQERSPIRVPAQFRGWCEETTARHVSALETAGYRVEGTLADLGCPDGAFAADDGTPGDDDIARAAVAALARVLALRMRARAGAGRDGGAAGGSVRSAARALLRGVRRRSGRVR